MFPTLVDRIIEASGFKKSDATLVFECNPRGVLLSTTRDNNSKPDCIGRLSSTQPDYNKRKWIEVAIAG